MKVIIIAAIGKNNELGKDNKLLWKSKSDLEHFKALTKDYPLIMGRKTYDSLPGVLPNREHIVLTKGYIEPHRQVSKVISFKNAINLASLFGKDRCFIIGGGQVYKKALKANIVDEMYITRMDWSGEADTFFPEIDDSWLNQGVVTRFISDINWECYHYTKKQRCYSDTNTGNQFK